VGKWQDPGLCDAYLYCAIKVGERITDFTGGGVSESSESSTSSSSSQESKSSESASSESDTLKGLDDYYAFIWDPKTNDFVVINDPGTGLPIPMPCRADRLAHWLLDSNDVTQTTMTNRKAGESSISAGGGWGTSKRWFTQGNWRNFIECIGRNLTEITIGGGGGYYIDDCTPMDTCDDPGSCTEPYWTDSAANYSGPPWYVFAKCGTYESGVINKTNPLTGETDSASFSITRTCTGGGGDQRLVVASCSLDAALIPSEDTNHDMFSSYIHDFDGFLVQSITSEDYDYYNNDISSVYVDAEYSTETFLGTMYNGWSIREYSFTPATYYAQALLAEKFIIGRRCSAGTFIWLGLQGSILRATDYGVGGDINWVIQNRHKYTQAYCDVGTYGDDPFTNKTNNSKISDAINEMIDRFYEEDPGGAVLDFEVDVRWVSGPVESYSSISSSSLSSSSLSSSSLSVSKESSSSSSESSDSSSSSSESVA
jgi:hypothetical protein